MRPGELAALRRNLVATFDHRVTVERYLATTTDPYGDDAEGTWTAVGVALPGSLLALSDEERFSPARDIETARYRLRLPFNADVRDTDRVVDVYAADGSLQEAGPLAVRSVERLETHTLLLVEKVS